MINLRVASVEDAEALSNIYSYYVENTSATYEYIPPDKSEFASRIAHKLNNYPFIVAFNSEKIIGYAYASQFRERAAYAWDTELSVYIDKDCTQKGIGKRLYAALLDILKAQNFIKAIGCISMPNEPSIALHKKLGFEFLGEFKNIGYKSGVWHNVVWYEKQINPLDNPKPIIPFPLLDKAFVENILSNN